MNEKIEKIDPMVPRVADSFALIGATKSGKSHLLKKLLYNDLRGVFDRVVFFSPTFYNETYKDIFEIPDNDVYTTFDEDDLLRIIDESKDAFQQTSGDYFTLIVLDDIADKTRKFKRFEEIIATCRHNAISFAMLLQNIKFIKPATREQITCYAVWPNVSNEILDSISESLFIGKKKAREAMDNLREYISFHPEAKYNFLWITKNVPDKVTMNFEHELIKVDDDYPSSDDDDSDEEK